MPKNPVFLYGVKIPYQHFFHFSHETIVYFMNTFLKVVKQLFRRGVNFNYVRVFFFFSTTLKDIV